MNKLTLLALLTCTLISAQSLLTPYEKGNRNQTVSYEEMNEFYSVLDNKYSEINIREFGLTDSGRPIQVIFYNKGSKWDYSKPQKKAVLLINNGIHPGEPDGIDASMMLLRDLAEGRIETPKNTLIAVIAAYNIGGMLNRNSFSRANQNGPEAYGFRGNARNFDLNRDFIKTDTHNARTFQEIYHTLNPDVFIDNHVSNGADYQYTLTYIATNRERLGNVLGTYYHDQMNVSINKDLTSKGIPPIPYVNVWNGAPDQGYGQFMDSPRYATGYTSLFNTIGQVPETHMLKPYAERVEATYQNMLSYLKFTDANYKTIKAKRKENLAQYLPGKNYPLQWTLDKEKIEKIEFKGYEGQKVKSKVTGELRLSYDRNKPFTKNINFYNRYKAELSVVIPRYYIVPQAEWKVVEELKRNRIQMSPLKKDSTVVAEIYSIASYETAKTPYEGHYNHFNTVMKAEMVQVKFFKGDYLISTDQPGVKYLLETLEPEAVDSFFNWNFFDAILTQKEHYSDYIFEDTAAELLTSDKALKTAFELQKRANPEMRKIPRMQLDWIYRNSIYFESSFLRYPVARIL